jgi:hypothetical protein
MLSPIAASARIRNGIRMARNRYSLARNGTATKAKTRKPITNTRSCRIGKSCWSEA